MPDHKNAVGLQLSFLDQTQGILRTQGSIVGRRRPEEKLEGRRPFFRPGRFRGEDRLHECARSVS